MVLQFRIFIPAGTAAARVTATAAVTAMFNPAAVARNAVVVTATAAAAVTVTAIVAAATATGRRTTETKKQNLERKLKQNIKRIQTAAVMIKEKTAPDLTELKIKKLIK